MGWSLELDRERTLLGGTGGSVFEALEGHKEVGREGLEDIFVHGGEQRGSTTLSCPLSCSESRRSRWSPALRPSRFLESAQAK
jgi:hypothetical protein